MELKLIREELALIKNLLLREQARQKENEIRKGLEGKSTITNSNVDLTNVLRKVNAKLNPPAKPVKKIFIKCGHAKSNSIVCKLSVGHEGAHSDTFDTETISWPKDTPCWYPPPILGPQQIKEGKTIKSGGNHWQVLKYDPDGDLVIRVLKVAPHFRTYLDDGGEYTLFEHKHNRNTGHYPMELWEIPGQQMKRSTSQMLLYLWSEGPNIDLDF